MKANRKIIFFVPLLFALLLCGCNGKRNKTMDNSVMSDMQQVGENKKAIVEMTISPNVYDSVPEKLSLTITNNTDNMVEYGAMYELEKFTEDSWHLIDFPEGIGFIAIQYMLQPGSSEVYEIYLYRDMIKYESGKYRVRKNIFIEEKSKPCYAEFEII